MRVPNENVQNIVDERPRSNFHLGRVPLSEIMFEGSSFYWTGDHWHTEYDPKDVPKQIRPKNPGFADSDLEYCLNRERFTDVEQEWADICRELGAWIGLSPETLSETYGTHPEPVYEHNLDRLDELGRAEKLEGEEYTVYLPTEELAIRATERSFE